MTDAEDSWSVTLHDVRNVLSAMFVRIGQLRELSPELEHIVQALDDDVDTIARLLAPKPMPQPSRSRPAPGP